MARQVDGQTDELDADSGGRRADRIIDIPTRAEACARARKALAATARPHRIHLPVHLQVSPPITLLAYRLLYAPSDRIIYHRRRRRSLYLIRTSRFASQSVFPRFSVFLAAIRSR